MLKEGAEDLEKTLAEVQRVLADSAPQLDKELGRKAQEAILNREQQMHEAKANAKQENKKRFQDKVKGNKAQNGKKTGRKMEEKIKGIWKRKVGEWVDESMLDWPDDDYRIHVGDLGNEINDETLAMAFKKYPSFLKAKVIRDKKNGKSRGYGFVSLGNPDEYIRAMKDMNGQYLGKRPLRLTKSTWKKRHAK